MLKNINIELKKLKHRKILLLLLGMIAVLFLWVNFTFTGNNSDIISAGYFNLLYQLPIMNTIILPLFIAVLASRIWDIENKGNTFKMLYTMQKPEKIFFCKTLIGEFLLLLLSLFECMMILLIGKIYHVAQAFPSTHVIAFFFVTFITSSFLYIMQEIITFSFENQVVPLAVGLIGSFLGLFSVFFIRDFQQFIIFSYYCLLQTIGLSWDPTTKISNFYEISISLHHFFVLCVLTMAIYPLGKLLLKRKDV